jgi:hypothetical protein
MNSRERVKAAIRIEKPDRIPVWYINVDHREGDVLWYDLRVYEDETTGSGLFRGSRSEWGYLWQNLKDGTMGHPIHPVIADAADIKKYRLPDIDLKKRFSGMADFIACSEGYYRLGMLVINGFTTYSFLRGFEEAMVDIATRDPDALALLADIFAWERELMCACADAGVHGFHIGDDWGMQDSMIISPAMWDEVMAPLYADFIGSAHSCGMDIWFHSCGNFTQIIPSMHDIGVDVINIAQPNVVDIEAVGRTLRGKQCFLMPLSYQTTSISGSAGEIIREAKRMHELLGTEKGGFIGYVEEYRCMGMSDENLEACKKAFRML